MSFDASKALKHNIVLIVGDEEARRRRALDSILAAAEVTKDDFDVEIFYGDSSTPQDWLASCGTAPFLGERRIAIVRNLYRLDSDKVKGLKLAGLPESALLVLVGDDETGSDEKLQRLRTTVRSSWEKVVTAAKGMTASCDADANAAREEIKESLAAAGKTMSPRSVDTLLEMTGWSLSRALDELEKLILFVGSQEAISEREIRIVVVPSREWNVFKMVDSIVSGSVGDALRQLQILLSTTKTAEDAAFSRILPLVSRQLRLMWQARLCVDAKCKPSTAPPEIASQFPDRPNLAKEQPYRQSSAMDLARRTSLDQLRGCFAILSDTDARLKGSLDSFTAVDTLERMVLEMAGTLGR